MPDKDVQVVCRLITSTSTDYFLASAISHKDMSMKLIQRKIYAAFLLIFSMSTMVHAGYPVWTFTPNPSYPPTASVPANGTATVQYTVTNQSTKPHTLVMTAIPGITPTVTGCASACPSSTTTLCLPTRGSTCTLTLSVDGSQLQGHVLGGPELCQQGRAVLCNVIYPPTP